MHKTFFHKLLDSRSQDEDSKRKEFILNVLLLSSTLLFFAAAGASLLISFLRPESYRHNSISLLILFSIFAFFAILLILSRKGFGSASAHILIIIFFLFALLMGYRWGIDVNASLLIYALVIVMAGILVNTRFAFLMTGLIAFVLISVGYLQEAGLYAPDRYWRSEPWQMSDTIMTAIIFFVIATVSWLSNREIERSLLRAHRSEDSLRKERDMLEATVEERTRELKEAQLEKISQLYSLAEFGRLSSGLFHDLMNPLTAVSLNVEKAKSEGQAHEGGLSKAEQYLDQAFVAAQRMERFIVAVRKQIGKEGDKRQFSPVEETRQVIDILSYKARLADVDIVLAESVVSQIVGDPVQWSQIMLNLISNGIDAYDDMPKAVDPRTVIVAFSEHKDAIVCTVLDHGIGIPKENMEKIFEPFFTTKPRQGAKGTGIGLSLVKRMIEKNFNGAISAASSQETGTIFSVVLSK
jgi:signal transduction histidine kinase